MIWLVLERGRGHEQTVAVRQIGQIEAERTEEDGPLIHHTDDDDLARAARIVLPCVGHLSLCVESQGRRGGVCRGKRTVRLHVNHETAAIEQHRNVCAQLCCEGALAQALILCLTGEDQTACLAYDRLQLRSGEENQKSLYDSGQQREKRCGNERKFHGSRAVFITGE